MRKKICIGLLAVLLGTGLGAMLVNHIWKEPKQGVDPGSDTDDCKRFDCADSGAGFLQ